MTLCAIFPPVLIACGEKIPKIQKGAIMPLKAENVPELVAKLGLEAFDRGNSLLLPAAETVAKTKSCDEVEYVLIDPFDSRKNNLVFNVFCANKSKFRLNEHEINQSK